MCFLPCKNVKIVERDIIFGEEKELEFTVYDSMVLYTDPLDGSIKKLGCALDMLSMFIS